MKLLLWNCIVWYHYVNASYTCNSCPLIKLHCDLRSALFGQYWTRVEDRNWKQKRKYQLISSQKFQKQVRQNIKPQQHFVFVPEELLPRSKLLQQVCHDSDVWLVPWDHKNGSQGPKPPIITKKQLWQHKSPFLLFFQDIFASSNDFLKKTKAK
jgi:hypothetical protein